MKVELHSEEPDQPLRPRLAELLKDAVQVDIAVVFVTEYGAEVI